jgi:hypothetical protein
MAVIAQLSKQHSKSKLHFFIVDVILVALLIQIIPLAQYHSFGSHSCKLNASGF